jgi:hypothetical protein
MTSTIKLHPHTCPQPTHTHAHIHAQGHAYSQTHVSARTHTSVRNTRAYLYRPYHTTARTQGVLRAVQRCGTHARGNRHSRARARPWHSQGLASPSRLEVRGAIRAQTRGEGTRGIWGGAGGLAHRTFSGVMSGVMYVVTAVVYTLR